eukprot:759632-Hanusia_phi.AAC.2
MEQTLKNARFKVDNEFQVSASSLPHLRVIALSPHLHSSLPQTAISSFPDLLLSSSPPLLLLLSSPPPLLFLSPSSSLMDRVRLAKERGSHAPVMSQSFPHHNPPAPPLLLLIFSVTLKRMLVHPAFLSRLSSPRLLLPQRSVLLDLPSLFA